MTVVRRFVTGGVAALLTGCPGPPGDPYRDASYDTANVSPMAYLEGLDPVVGCTVAATDPRHEDLETRCDGVDNDCDGIVDQLVPLAPNACSTGLQGVCATGWAACVNGVRVCYGPAPTPEVADGLDNDCNGRVDDLPAPAMVHPRVLLLPPPSAYMGGTDEISTTAAVMDQWGIPYDLAPQGQPWNTVLTRLSGYALVFIPGELGQDELTPAQAARLDGFARGGGVVVLTTPANASGPGNSVLGLLGLTATVATDMANRLLFDGPAVTPLGMFDSVEERNVPLTADTAMTPVPVALLTPDATAGTVPIAHAFTDGTSLGVAATRRTVGLGAVYTLGTTMTSFEVDRCYINCFDPSLDLLGLFLREAVREAAGGHVVFKHTVPGVQDSLMALTHDLDAPDAQNSGPWGAPGGQQMAELEHAHGALGTFEMTTDYVVGYWNPDLAVLICSLGMCPLGAHSVRHALDIATVPYGTGAETRDTYDALNAETLTGEVRVSQQLLTEVTGQRPRVWRSPYLDVNPLLFDALAASGFTGDSSFAVGDFQTNLPFNVGAVGFYQEVFHHRDVVEYLISSEDGIGSIDANGLERRTELQRDNIRQFVSNWTYIALRNAANRAHDIVLIHPSYGVGVGSENQQMKLVAADRILRTAEAAHLRTNIFLEPLTVFWHARDRAALDAVWDGHGYHGTVTPAEPITDLTLEFGEPIHTFTCPACGPVTVAGRRVVLASLSAGTALAFTATP